jgi:hypothetical protein
VIGVYVDDLLIAGPMEDNITKFKQEMTKQFRMSGLGLLTYYLGIEVCEDSSGISLCQAGYARKLLERQGCSIVIPVTHPWSRNCN